MNYVHAAVETNTKTVVKVNVFSRMGKTGISAGWFQGP